MTRHVICFLSHGEKHKQNMIYFVVGNNMPWNYTRITTNQCFKHHALDLHDLISREIHKSFITLGNNGHHVTNTFIIHFFPNNPCR